ncbi:cell growth regulator with EF hand domain protein 1 isoform X1 [Trachinotus anak]|uniref:cell growth regulator with EF hand domain protein 1 isoform X1 n=1 Tax=Trachinotus anak TaxID=443729 RepID=UPI0039F264D4
MLTESPLGKFVPCVLYLLVLIHLCLAAPGLTGTQREETADGHPPSIALPNPFGSGEEDRRLLQSYIQSSLKDGQGGPEISTWEQEVFFLFRLYDYDRSGLLDGLEMMKLLSDYSSHHTPGAQANELVVSMVDFLLQTQDANQDGLLAPSELLSPSLPHTQEQEATVEEKLSNPSTDEEKAGAAEQREEAHADIQPQEEEQPQHEVDEQNGQQLPEAPAVDQGAPVHQGQPEI